MEEETETKKSYMTKYECKKLSTYYKNLMLMADEKKLNVSFNVPEDFFYCEEAAEIIKNPRFHPK